MTPRTPFGDWPAGARRTWGWAAVLLVAASYLVSALPLGIGIVAYSIVRAMEGASPAPLEAGLQDATLPLLLPLLLVQFILWGAMALAWARWFERRSLSSLGLVPRGWAARYSQGLFIGVVLVLVLGLASALAAGGEPPAGETAPDLAEADWSRLAEPAVLMVLVGLGAVFLVQGGAEELIFRGWLMSVLSARWGVIAGVIATSLVFMLFHAHVFMSGVGFGIAALAGIGATGLFFALFAVWTRNIVGVAAIHGAFNASAVIGPVAVRLAADPETSLSRAVSDVFNAATGMAGPEAVNFGPELLVQFAVFAGVCAIVGWRLSRRRDRKRSGGVDRV